MDVREAMPPGRLCLQRRFLPRVTQEAPDIPGTGHMRPSVPSLCGLGTAKAYSVPNAQYF